MRAKSKYYLPLILLFIFADVLCDNYIFHTFNNQTKFTQLLFSLIFLVVQIFASPIQAGFSDFYCRKKSLVISLSFSCLSLFLYFLFSQNVLPYFSVLVFLLLIKGAVGNTIPIAWASIADTQEKEFRFSFGLSTAFFAIGYITLISAEKYLKDIQTNLLIMLVFVVLIIFCVFLFNDIRDKDNKSAKIDRKEGSRFRGFYELKEIFTRLKQKHIRNGVAAFFLWEVSLYSILLLYVDFGISEFSATGLMMMIGYLWGIFLLKYCPRVADEKIIKIGYCLLCFSLVPIFFSFLVFKNSTFLILSSCYFFHSWGNAFLSAAFFAALSKRSLVHEQGKNYGLVESADTCAILVSSLVAMGYKSSVFGLFYVIFISFVTALISWIPYKNFKNEKHLSLR